MINPFEEIEKIANNFDSLNDHEKQLVSSTAYAAFTAGQNYQKEVDESSFEYAIGKQVKDAMDKGLDVSISMKPYSDHITINFTKA